MKYLATIWWVVRNFKSFVKVYSEGKDVYDAVKKASSEESDGGKQFTKKEYVGIIDEVKEFLESLKLGGK